jgi:tetratricopeptide (TPR) repeat protein
MRHRGPGASRRFYILIGLMLVAAVLLLDDPSDRRSFLRIFGLERLMAPPAVPPQLDFQPAPAGGIPGRGRDGRRSSPVTSIPPSPCPASLDAWMVHPTVVPPRMPIDGFDWHVMADVLALGLTYLGSKPCIDTEFSRNFVEEIRAPTDGRAPAADRLAELSKRFGAAHILIPVLETSRAGPVSLTVLAAHARTGFAPERLDSVKLERQDRVRSGLAVTDMVARVLRKLGARFPAPGSPAAGRPLDLVPPAPLELLARLRERAGKLAAGPMRAERWIDLGLDYAMLGYYLTEGMSWMGPVMLVRGAALTTLGHLLAPDDGRARAARAASLLFARHPAGAMALLEPLLRADDRQARLLALACRGEARPLATVPGAELLMRLAAVRSGDPEVVSSRIKELATGALPLDYLLVGLARRFDVGSARAATWMWLASEASTAARDPDVASRPRPSAAASPSLARTTSAVEAAIAALAETGSNQIERSARRRFAAHRDRSFGSPVRQVGPISVAPLPHHLHRVLSDAVCLPGIEYALVTGHLFGVPSEATAVLQALQNLRLDGAWVSCVRPAWDVYHGRERGGGAKWVDWVEQWMVAESRNPWAQASQFAASWHLAKDWRTDANAWALWDLGCVDTRLVRLRTDALVRSAGLAPALADDLARELSVDPWDPELWLAALEHAKTAMSRESFAREVARARRTLPRPGALLAYHAAQERRWGNPIRAEAILKEGIAIDPDYRPFRDGLVDLHLEGLRLGKARRAARDIQERWPRTLGTAILLARIGEQYLVWERLKEARELTDAARAIDDWQGNVLEMNAALCIREGKVAEGRALIRREIERYGEDRISPYCTLVGQLALSGRLQDAIQEVEKIPVSVAGWGQTHVYLARIFLQAGDTARWAKHLERAWKLWPAGLSPLENFLRAQPRLATMVVVSRDAKRLSELLARTEGAAHTRVIELLNQNLHPEAVDALLSELRAGRNRELAARALAGRAGIDLGHASDRSTPAELDLAHTRLAAWWKQARSRYPESQLE